MSMKVLIADDHQVMREGLRSLLEKQPGVTVVGEAENGRTALRLVQELSPDVIVMDVSMPDFNGIDATTRVKAEFPRVKVIALSMHDDRRFVLNMIKAGASGYILKENSFKELAKAIQMVRVNKIYLSDEISDFVVKEHVGSATPIESSAAFLLTKREIETLRLIAAGKTSSQIAKILQMSPKTVETHRSSITIKLNIKGISELTKYAIREGLTTLEP
jgi:DNA-binding NarL/FixJ family response regulator